MNSLGTRMAFVLASALFLLVVIAGSWVERKLTDAISNEEIDQAKIHAQTLLASLQILMINGQGTLARDWVDSLRGTAGIVDIAVLRRDGTEAFSDLNTVFEVNSFLDAPVFEREPVPSRYFAPPSESHQAFNNALRGEVVVDSRFPEEVTVLQPIASGTECMSCHGYDSNPLRGVLRLSLSREHTLIRIAQMRANLWAVALVLVLVLAVVVWGVVRVSVLWPINQLRDAIVRVGAGERNVKLKMGARDELGQVVTVFNAMQDQLLATETRIRAVTENVFDAIITADEQGIIESVNHAVEKMYGYTAKELVGQNVSMLMPEPYRREHDRYMQKYIITGRGRVINSRIEVVGQRKDGSTFPLELAVSEMIIGDRRYFNAVVRDITELKRQTAALQHQALHDALTELPNRTLLSDRIRQSILLSRRNQQPLALLVLDLDRFKEINDTLGHQYGDRVLQQAAKRMREVLRESDTIARLGGDEFAVLLPRTNVEQATHIAAKLLSTVDAPFYAEAQLLHVGVSIGIALFPQHGEDEVMLLQRADVAMYVAKRNHLGYSLYDPLTDQHSLKNLALLGELRLAIDMDQLVLYYQPKVDMATGRVYGVEALVRWNHPVHGLLSPDEFVPLAEQAGLIGALSEWVLTAGLSQCETHLSQGMDLHVALNMSVRNMQDPEFPRKVSQLISDLCREPGLIRLEITETAIMEDPVRALEALGMLSDMGVKMSIDDFGTGYSSLTHLKQMPVDELKIDQSFVRDMVEDESDAVIVRSIIDLAHNIGIAVVAEGVHNQATYEMLKTLGCDAVQGYYVAKPMTAEALAKWLESSAWGWRPPSDEA